MLPNFVELEVVSNAKLYYKRNISSKSQNRCNILSSEGTGEEGKMSRKITKKGKNQYSPPLFSPAAISPRGLQDEVLIAHYHSQARGSDLQHERAGE